MNRIRIEGSRKRLTAARLATPGTALPGSASSRLPEPRSLRPLLIRDHERLDALFVNLLDQFVEGGPEDVRAIWALFDAALSAHLDVEERYLLAALYKTRPEEAAALLEEHAVFRRTLDELGVGIDLHVVSPDVAQEFVEALRTHARRENELFTDAPSVESKSRTRRTTYPPGTARQGPQRLAGRGDALPAGNTDPLTVSARWEEIRD